MWADVKNFNSIWHSGQLVEIYIFTNWPASVFLFLISFPSTTSPPSLSISQCEAISSHPSVQPHTFIYYIISTLLYQPPLHTGTHGSGPQKTDWHLTAGKSLREGDKVPWKLSGWRCHITWPGVLLGDYICRLNFTVMSLWFTKYVCSRSRLSSNMLAYAQTETQTPRPLLRMNNSIHSLLEHQKDCHTTEQTVWKHLPALSRCRLDCSNVRTAATKPTLKTKLSLGFISR